MTSYLAVTGPGTISGPAALGSDAVPGDRHRGARVEHPVDGAARLALRRGLPRPHGGTTRGVPRHAISGRFFFQDEPVVNVLFSDARAFGPSPRGCRRRRSAGLFTGDLSGTGIRLVPDWSTPEESRSGPHHKPTPPNIHNESPVIAGHHRIHWANCTALAVLMLSYAVMLFRPGERRAVRVTPTESFPPAAANGKKGARSFWGSIRNHRLEPFFGLVSVACGVPGNNGTFQPNRATNRARRVAHATSYVCSPVNLRNLSAQCELRRARGSPAIG